MSKAAARIGDFERGVEFERARIIAYLMKKGVLRDALFYEGYVAVQNKPVDGVWPVLDLPTDLGANGQDA